MFEGAYPIIGFINLAILIAALIYFFRRPIVLFFSSRSKKLADRRSDAVESLMQAEKDHGKYYDQIRNINQHMEKMMENAEIEGEKEGQEMLLDAERIADRIISQSMTRADHEVKRKNVEFYRDVAEKSVKEAEDQIKKKLTIEKQIKLGHSYLKQLREYENNLGR